MHVRSIVSLVVGLVFSVNLNGGDQRLTLTVKKIIDPDTIKCELPTCPDNAPAEWKNIAMIYALLGSEVNIRLLCVNAPETRTKRHKLKPLKEILERISKEGKELTKDNIARNNNLVTLTDIKGFDSFGRLLACASAGSVDLSDELKRNKLATEYHKSKTKSVHAQQTLVREWLLKYHEQHPASPQIPADIRTVAQNVGIMDSSGRVIRKRSRSS